MIKRPLREKPPNFEDGDEDEDEIVTTQRRRRPKYQIGVLSCQEKEDLDKDLQFLGSPERFTNENTLASFGHQNRTPDRKALEVLKAASCRREGRASCP